MRILPLWYFFSEFIQIEKHLPDGATSNANGARSYYLIERGHPNGASKIILMEQHVEDVPVRWQSGEHGADQCRVVVPARPTSHIILLFPLDNCFFSVGLLYKSPSRRTIECQGPLVAQCIKSSKCGINVVLSSQDMMCGHLFDNAFRFGCTWASIAVVYVTAWIG